MRLGGSGRDPAIDWAGTVLTYAEFDEAVDRGVEQFRLRTGRTFGLGSPLWNLGGLGHTCDHSVKSTNSPDCL